MSINFKKGLFKYLGVPFIIFIFLYLLFDKMLMPAFTRHGQAVDVPDVTTWTYEEARTLLKNEDLEIVEKEKKFDSNFRAGTIISQHPKAHATVKKGRRIYVIVSKGDPTFEMPLLIGQSEKNALFEIEKLGLQLRYTHYDHSSEYPEGVVMDQSIIAGENVKVGGLITLKVSDGEFPDQFIIPNLIGRSLKDAKRIIEKDGLTLGNVSYQVENDLLPETVIDQSIEPETEVAQGDTIDLKVSKLAITNERY